MIFWTNQPGLSVLTAETRRCGLRKFPHANLILIPRTPKNNQFLSNCTEEELDYFFGPPNCLYKCPLKGIWQKAGMPNVVHICLLFNQKVHKMLPKMSNNDMLGYNREYKQYIKRCCHFLHYMYGQTPV